MLGRHLAGVQENCYRTTGWSGLVLPALRLQGVHGPHEAGGPSVALLHGDAGPRGIELVAGPVLLVEDEPLLTLALRGLGGVVEGEVVAGRTGTAGVEFIALTNRSDTLTHIRYLVRPLGMGPTKQQHNLEKDF